MTHKISNIKDIAHKYSTFFFDLDGVIVINHLSSGKDLKKSKEESRLLIY